MGSLALYELVGQYKSLEALSASEDLPPEVIRDTLDGLTGEIQEKSTNVAAFLKNLEAAADAIDEAAAQMKERSARLRKRADSLKMYLLLNMQACEITRIEAPQFVIALRNNPPTVVVDDEKQIPGAYFVQIPATERVDKQAIAKAYKAGESVPGTHVEQYQRVEIK